MKSLESYEIASFANVDHQLGVSFRGCRCGREKSVEQVFGTPIEPPMEVCRTQFRRPHKELLVICRKAIRKRKMVTPTRWLGVPSHFSIATEPNTPLFPTVLPVGPLFFDEMTQNNHKAKEIHKINVRETISQNNPFGQRPTLRRYGMLCSASGQGATRPAYVAATGPTFGCVAP